MESLLVFLIVFLIVAFLQVPVAFSLGLAGLAAFYFSGLPLTAFSQAVFTALDNIPFLAIPLFILAGAMMEHSGISDSLLKMVNSYIGRARGKAGAITISGSAAFGVLTGSAAATITAIGKIMIPEMIKQKYDKAHATALVAASSFLGILIPPSVPGIIFGFASGQRISDVWLSTVAPGILIVIGYLIFNHRLKGRFEEKSTEKVAPLQFLRNAATQTRKASGALLMPIIIFGGIYGGVFTPTEAGAVSAFYVLIYYLFKKFFKKGSVTSSTWKIVVSSASVTAVISLLIVFSTTTSVLITYSGAATTVTEFLVDNVSGPIQFLILANILFLIMGMFLDINASIMIVVPLLMPSVMAFNIDPIHFAAITLLAFSIGYITPPFCSSIFIACKIADSDFVRTVRAIVPYSIVPFIVLIIIIFVPQIPLSVPNLFR